MQPNVHCSTIHNSQDMGTTEMSMTGERIKMWYVYTMEHYSAIKKWNNAICSNMDGPGGDQTKSERERRIPYDIICMWESKKMQTILSVKQRQTQAQRTDWLSRGRGLRECCIGSLGLADAILLLLLLEKEMAPHSSVLAWRIPGTGEPGGLPSMGSHRVGHDWRDLAAAAAFCLVSWPLSLSGTTDLSFDEFLFVYSVCSNQHQQMVDSLIYNSFNDNDRELLLSLKSKPQKYFQH